MIENKKLLIINKGALPDEYVTFLNKKGINAILLQFSPQKKYIYKNSKITDKLMNAFHRLFLKNNNYIYTLENKSYSKEYCIQIKEFFKKETFFDYVLILRPDNFDSSFLKIVKNHSEKVIGYMWDALNEYKYSILKKNKKYFHRIYLFEKEDLIKYPNLNGLKGNNYYFENEGIKSLKKENLISYIGNITKDRRDLFIEKMIPYLEKSNYEIQIILINNIDKELNSYLSKHNKIQILNTHVHNSEHLKAMAKSKVSLDLIPSYHTEYSFRVYESIYYETKLITTNKNIINFPLYRKENFLLIENELDFQKIPEFISTAYKPYKEEELSKLRFDNWIKNIFKH